jgi:hypothetical protein
LVEKEKDVERWLLLEEGHEQTTTTAKADPPPAAKDDNQKAAAMAKADPYGMTTKRTVNSKCKARQGGGFTFPPIAMRLRWMGHPRCCGWVREDKGGGFTFTRDVVVG